MLDPTLGLVGVIKIGLQMLLHVNVRLYILNVALAI